MKKVVLVATALAVATSVALPGAALGQTVTGDSVVGRADFSSFPGGVFIDIDARSGAAGENPTGTVRSAGGPGGLLFWRGDVTCLNVSANRATVGIFVASFSAAFFYFVEDNDGVGADTVGFGGTQAPFGPTKCPATPAELPFALQFPPFPIEDGDVVVHDAEPPPTSKAQCKHGGWQTFGNFKNQGDCVSFVATGGNNPPAGSTKP